MKEFHFLHCADENKLGAVLLTAFGLGLLFFLPETIAVSRFAFAAFALMLVWRFCERSRREKMRRNILIAAGIFIVALILSGVETGAKLAISGSFLLVAGSMLYAMLLVPNLWERIGTGASGIAALLLALAVLMKIARLDLVECRSVFSAASFAGALTLFLRPQNRRKI